MRQWEHCGEDVVLVGGRYGEGGGGHEAAQQKNKQIPRCFINLSIDAAAQFFAKER